MDRLHPEILFKKDEARPLTLKQGTLTEVSRPSFCAGRKFGEVEQALVWSLLHKEPEGPSRVLLDTVAERQIAMAVSLRHVHRWRATWGRNRRKGRPGHAPGRLAVACGAEVGRVVPHVAFVGGHLFAHWLDQQHTFEPVVAQLPQAIETSKHRHPDEDFVLRHHREPTLRRRLQALFFAPLLGSERLSGFDTPAQPLETLVGRGYHRATLGQFLGQLERLGAAAVLSPVLAVDQGGQMLYVDGHLMASWSRLPMHKGQITMLGRIMAGSQAVIAHDETGRAVFVAYYAPDLHLAQIILAYCPQVAEATGSAVFVIDRAVHSVALAAAFDEQGWGLLCMLDDNEQAGLASFAATYVAPLEDGTTVESGPGKESRKDAPRHGVIVHPAAGQTLVYWSPPKVKDAWEAQEWPGVSRERHEIQEHRCKDMLDHGALAINYGRKKMSGADRHHQRKQGQLAQSLETAPKRVDKKAEALQAQQDKVAESASKGHGKRLEQRPRTLRTLEQACKEATAQQAQCSEQAST